MDQEREIKTKHLHCLTIEHGIIDTRMYFNINTEHITFNNAFYKSKGYRGTSGTNKDCSNWLGDKAETILMNMFDTVQKMPYDNPGYDFICGKGHKIDCKSRCLGKRDINTWTFPIHKNKTADYFLCLAFDNRNNMTPLHVWLIPGIILNDKDSVSISKSTINKWKQYEKSLDKVLVCCNTMKNIEGE
jgi:hypothetical protein